MSLMINTAKGDRYVDRCELARVPTPGITSTWHPVPHIELVETVDDIVRQHGWSITDERFGLVRDRQKMFGVMTLAQDGNPEWTRCIGIRNSHDKSLCAGITAGVSVLVCSNLCFGGTTVIQRKHTSGINLHAMVDEAMDSLMDNFLKLENTLDRLHDMPVTVDDAKLIIVHAAEQDAIPSCDILPVLNEFVSPRHREFREQTQWSLLNAFTEIGHKYTPSRSDRMNSRLTQMFGLNGLMPAMPVLSRRR